jgi:hypothetical protein
MLEVIGRIIVGIIAVGLTLGIPVYIVKFFIKIVNRQLNHQIRQQKYRQPNFNNEQHNPHQQNYKYQQPNFYTPLFYHKKSLLTSREGFFYTQYLRPILEKYRLTCCCKVRLADLLEPKQNSNRSEWTTAFNKINRKHIDFVIVDYDMQVILLVELDDTTHQQPNRRQRDEFVDNVVISVGYRIIHTYGEVHAIENILFSTFQMQNQTLP